MTGVSHSDEAKLKDFCLKDSESTGGASGRDGWMLELRNTLGDVDNAVGSMVSEAMCSHLCPCDFDDLPLAAEKQWLELFANEEKLSLYDRCNGGKFCNEETGEIVLFKGIDTSNVIAAEMKEFNIKQYKIFRHCLEDMKNGRRDTRQISEEAVKDLRKKYDSKKI